ncbi:MAG: cytochrome c oxidase subunit II [Methylococcales bacterium]|nr:cytochrome c oxidase subunit II [Methylococcales bacterium]
MEGVTSLSKDVYDLHMFALWVCVVIGVLVFGAMFYSIYHHRKSKGHKAAQFHHSTKVEIIWSIIPTIILIVMAVPATTMMLDMDDVENSEMSIKITGWQWKWEYEYMDNDIHFFSSLDAASNQARQINSGINPRDVPHYLLNVDNPLVVPIDTKIRFLLTAGDVIHSWWVPDLGWKKDTIPGFVTEAWTKIEKAGTYRGQCAELCGKDHGFMPIVLIAMEKEDYATWVEEQAENAVLDAKAATKEWTADELIEKGETVYASNCSSCHMADGSGMAGTFPALTNNELVLGDMDAQVDLMMNGKDMMPAFGQMLSPVDFAAVSTFIRNSLGNEVGDSIQPSAIKAKQSALPKDDDDDD